MGFNNESTDVDERFVVNVIVRTMECNKSGKNVY